MTQKTINLIAIITSFGLMLLIIPALCHATDWQYDGDDKYTWENLTPTGSERMVIIDGQVDRGDFDRMVRLIPITGYGYAVAYDRTVMCFEPQKQTDWPTIKKWVEMLRVD